MIETSVRDAEEKECITRFSELKVLVAPLPFTAGGNASDCGYLNEDDRQPEYKGKGDCLYLFDDKPTKAMSNEYNWSPSFLVMELVCQFHSKPCCK